LRSEKRSTGSEKSWERIIIFHRPSRHLSASCMAVAQSSR
jgi:hypothetical protein